MDICGYIYLYDADTNRRDIMKIKVFNCSNLAKADLSVKSVTFTIDKLTGKIVSPNPDFYFVSYLMLQEIIATSVSFDKCCEYPSVAEFSLDINGNPYIRIKNTSKEIFPLPCNSDAYTLANAYINITKTITGQECVSVLKSSLYAHHLNYLALKDGFMSDKLFYSVCGRVFLNTSFLTKSVKGIEFIKQLFPADGNKEFLDRILKKPVGFNIKRYKVDLLNYTDNPDFSNPFHKIITYGSKNLSDLHLLTLSASFGLLTDTVEAEVTAFSPYFDNLLWQGVVKAFDDFEYITCDDLLCLGFSYGRDMLGYHLINNRKFYNAHKSVKITGVYANGEVCRD